MAHPTRLKKRRDYTWSLRVDSKAGRVIFRDNGTASDPILAHIHMMERIKIHSNSKWHNIVTQVAVKVDHPTTGD